MNPAAQTRTTRARLFRGLPVLVALLVGLLQAGTPFAHVFLHLAAARTEAQVRHTHTNAQPGLNATLADERVCPLCAADEVPALEGPRPPAAVLQVARAGNVVVPAQERSTEPLQVFCRPPPSA